MKWILGTLHHLCQVEALFQNVLMYPRLPSRVAAWLPDIEADIDQVTETVEALADKFGAELGFYIIRRQPAILNIHFQTLVRHLAYLYPLLGWWCVIKTCACAHC